MTFLVDSREKDATLLHAADQVKLLRYRNPNNESAFFSYDMEVQTLGGQRLRFERKIFSDLKASFFAGYLDRQVSAVDALVVEWNDVEIIADMPSDDKDRRGWEAQLNSVRNHLARLALCCPVIMTSSVHDTIRRMRYLERQEGDVHLFENRVNVKAPSMLEKVARGLMPSMTSDKFVDEILPLIDADKLVEALAVDEWNVADATRKRIREGILNGQEEAEP